MTRAFRPLVVGSPRSGFALLCSVCSHLIPLAPPASTLRQRLLDTAIDVFGDHIPSTVVGAFAEVGIRDDLIYNASFRKFTGGPKWLNPERPSEARLRKYIGVRGKGDFSLVTSHPRAVLDYDEVVHSHSAPALWTTDPGYHDYVKLASVRNPIGIINSSLFSINALTSEYIQRFLPPEQDNDELRQELALYKFTDLDFFEGIVKFYARYFTEFMAVRGHYIVMRWEDLITAPAATIARLAQSADIPLAEDHAAEIWQRLDHVNLTGAHRHNYRRGKGKVGDWKNWMTNRHLEIIRAHGFEPVMEALGYGRIAPLDDAAYTPFQRRVQEMLDRGEIYRSYGDPDLFGFAFNKSNLDSEKFPFRRYGWKNATQVERSSFTDDALLERVWEAADRSVVRLNRVLTAVLDGDYATERAAERSIAEVRRAAADFRVFMPKAYEALVPSLEGVARRALNATDSTDLDGRPPRLIRALSQHNIVGYQRRFYVIAHSVGPLDLATHAVEAIPGAVGAATFSAAQAAIRWLEHGQSSPKRDPQRIAAPAGYEALRADDLIWAAPTGTLPADAAPVALAQTTGLVAASTVDELTQLCPRAGPTPTKRPCQDVSGLFLEFVADETSALAQAAETLVAAGLRVCLRPWNDRARHIAAQLLDRFPAATVFACDASETDGTKVVRAEPLDPRIDATVLLDSDGDELAAALMDYLDLKAGQVVAPITSRHCSKLPLFLISVPKGGTHLLFELAHALGYLSGGTCPDTPQPRYWYYLEYSNSHTSAPDFFIDTVRRQPFGNRAHPFPRTPSLFIYRHPLDVLISEVNYYHRASNSPFGAYFAPLTFEQRLHRLIDDPWLLGTLRDRIASFAAWLEFPNVVPVSFEELVGDAGGGSNAMQRKAIWSLQLKLHVPGDPEVIARTIFNKESPTFHTGRIGSHSQMLDADARNRLRALSTDYIEVFGYGAADGQHNVPRYSRRIEEFRKRPLLLNGQNFADTPILLESDWLGHSIVGFRGRFYALRHGGGDVDLAAMSDDALAVLPQAPERSALKQHLLAGIVSEAVTRQAGDRLANLEANYAKVIAELQANHAKATADWADQLAQLRARIDREPGFRLGDWLGYDLWRFNHHILAVQRSAAIFDPIAEWPRTDPRVMVGHSRSGLMLRIGFARLAKMLRGRRPS